jgi:hypothetical protein
LNGTKAGIDQARYAQLVLSVEIAHQILEDKNLSKEFNECKFIYAASLNTTNYILFGPSINVNWSPSKKSKKSVILSMKDFLI